LETSLREKENQYRGFDQQVRAAHQEIEVLRNNLNESNRRFAEY